ncbi:C4-dicarboxylic acid transporter DauA [Mariprofundus ferrooxydans]|uniref:C4-dicarboxylic acid transporter DauA n=1 Tax=Mariprofundus ferrooxydans TaxID=314344 RepID=UPI00038153EC|nr:C4-dicarboxylic acid transporter DauA [Mariprofundus ferrooxydans]
MIKALFAAATLRQNILAGLTVGIVALPLSMALAIASGVPPQHGLYTAIIAGIVIALSGSSRVNISGPTAACVVILLPIVQQFGLGGLLISGLMAGMILIVMGVLRLGTLIELVPYPVTVGFTSGIAVVIATTQIGDFLGLTVAKTGNTYIDKVQGILHALPTIQLPEVSIALITLIILLNWQKLGTRIPSHLAALVVGTLLAWLGGTFVDGFSVSTLASEFHYSFSLITESAPGGVEVSGNGIPPLAPQFLWPWLQPDADGNPIGLSLHLLANLFGAAIAIALLGAIESLLCAVVSDSMAGTRTDPNRELIGQGIGNLIVPFFGGIPATAAIARTATNVRSGATTPLSSVVHAMFMLLAMLSLAPLLGLIPMASMAALLMVVAWNMSEAKHFVNMLRVAPRHDILVLVTCFSLTVLLDMEVAVAAGMGLAGFLFIKRMTELTGVKLINPASRHGDIEVPDAIMIYDINGPMFFGAAQNALKTLLSIRKEIKVVIIDMSDVPMIDMTAMVAMQSIINNLAGKGISLVFCGMEADVKVKLKRADILKRDNIYLQRSIADSVAKASALLAEEKQGELS